MANFTTTLRSICESEPNKREDVEGIFGSTNNGYALTLKPSAEEALQLWLNSNESSIVLCGNLSVKLFRFALEKKSFF